MSRQLKNRETIASAPISIQDVSDSFPLRHSAEPVQVNADGGAVIRLDGTNKFELRRTEKIETKKRAMWMRIAVISSISAAFLNVEADAAMPMDMTGRPHSPYL